MSTSPEPDELEIALAAAERLAEQDQPLTTHAEAFERVHELLGQRLGQADG